VNVHPTKSEVRFKDSGRIHGLVMAGVREKLLGSELTPHAVARKDDLDDAQRTDLRTKLADFFRMAPTQGTFGAMDRANVPPDSHNEAVPSIPFAPPVASSPAHVESWLASWQIPPLPRAAGDASDTERKSNPDPIPSAPSASVGANHHDALAEAPRAPAIQLHNSYLVAQSDDGMIIIDQHALHERIMFEELSARIMRGALESQRLLIPETIPASSRQIALLEHIQPLLNRLGIEASQFGPNSVAVQAFPSFLHKLEPGVFVAELLERGEQELLDLHEEELLHEILDMMACKAAVKAGDPLSTAEIEALLARRELIERSSNCPHGRPTTLRLSLRDLEKQFKRTGF
jgi:DNA mismatch repair protein MutL